MTVYHGSVAEVRVPDLSRSKSCIDFGPGFYVTTLREQAERWALRKAARTDGVAVVNVYGLRSDWSSYRVRTFAGACVDWLDFVCACRNGFTPYLDFDIISGKVADDRVYQAIDMYRRGIWDAERTLREISYYEDSNQIVLNNAEAIRDLLSFDRAYEVKP